MSLILLLGVVSLVGTFGLLVCCFIWFRLLLGGVGWVAVVRLVLLFGWCCCSVVVAVRLSLLFGCCCCSVGGAVRLLVLFGCLC